MKTSVVRGAILLVLALLIVAAGGWIWIHDSLPRIEGEARAAVKAPVRIVRDADGIPHIFAASERDGWFGMGYAHGQDRLFQMEFQRRVARGRLSEMVGEPAYENDKLMRTLGLGHLSERIVARLDADTREHLEAYAAGVNAAAAATKVLPIEFQALRVGFEPWTPADSVGWLLVMAWDLSSNWKVELARLRFSAKMGRERTAQLLPPYPGDKDTALPDFGTLYEAVKPQAQALLTLSPLSEGAVGSNNWVVGGARSATGKPLLANDPHLGLQTPALWYLAHVSTPAGNVVGGTLPGVPFVVIGRNDHVAWGFTTTNGDTQDLFIEKVSATDPRRYLTPKGEAAFETREEVIGVRGGERRYTVRATRHGPVISDAVKAAGEGAPKGHVLALAWAALTEENFTARAGLRLNRAHSRAEAMEAVRDFAAPQQNLVVADRQGSVGFIAAARVPIRRGDNEAQGRVPVPGWIARYDWEGFIPFEKLPQVVDPPSGRIVTANHKITPPGYKPFISVDWFPPYRADRIEELLAATPKHSVESFARMQADSVSRLAREMLPHALAARPSSDDGRAAQAMLAGWKADMVADAAAPLVYAAWYRELTRLVYADELGELFNESWDQRAAFMIPVMKGERGLDKWCDDVRTKPVETCAQLASRAFDLAAADLRTRFGDPATWRWGLAHRAASDHRPFGFFPGLDRIFNVSPATPGDAFAIDVGHYWIRDEGRPYANRHAPSLRVVFDLADLDRSLYMQSTGQSGNILSPWYSNLAERWAKVEYVTIPTKPEAIGSVHELVLRP